LLYASIAVTVMVDVVVPSAITLAGEAVTVDCAAVAAPAADGANVADVTEVSDPLANVSV